MLVADKSDRRRSVDAFYGNLSFPNRRIDLAVTGDTTGRWDGPRLQQLLRNLISTAISHGAANGTVRVGLTGRASDVICEVTNSGPAIEVSALERMFQPLERTGAM